MSICIFLILINAQIMNMSKMKKVIVHTLSPVPNAYNISHIYSFFSLSENIVKVTSLNALVQNPDKRKQTSFTCRPYTAKLFIIFKS